ncbi:MAG: YeeE/YedE thiosulfate transporter family protein [Flavobacteriaceae bacterium]
MNKISLKNLFKNQWSYVYAGILFAIAQVIYMLAIWFYKAGEGKTPNLMSISVTTDLGRMFRGMEVFINNLFGIYSELYGNYGVDAAGNIIPEGGVFTPGIGWPIVGMILGGWIVTKMEKESRTWVYYSKKALIVSFFGGAFFSYGTRMAGGCTLTHLMGGVPFMGIRSFGSVIFMAMGGALGFLFMEKMGLANYFKHQETKAYVENADAGEQATIKKGYNYKKNPVFWLALSFTVLFLGAALYGAISGTESMQHLKGGKLVAFGKSVADRNGLFVFLTLLSGTIAGIALSKSGYGTECALVALETSGDMTKKDEKYAKMGVPKITRTLMRSNAPIIGVVTTWILMLGFMLIAWTFFNISPALGNGLKAGLTAGNFIGGLFLGFGAVTLIGCEIRSYMRIGMGYINTLVGFVGFAVGYLPYTLFSGAHKDFLDATVLFGTHRDGSAGLISSKRELYSLFTDNPTMQKVIMFIWMLLLIFFLRYLLKKGAKNIGLKPVHLIHLNTEDIQETIEKEQVSGRIGDVDAPMPVPVGSYAKK